MQMEWASLHFSASRGYLETARILILGGANVNAITKVRLSVQW